MVEIIVLVGDKVMLGNSEEAVVNKTVTVSKSVENKLGDIDEYILSLWLVMSSDVVVSSLVPDWAVVNSGGDEIKVVGSTLVITKTMLY